MWYAPTFIIFTNLTKIENFSGAILRQESLRTLSTRSSSKRHRAVATRIKLAVFSWLLITFWCCGKELIYYLKTRFSWWVFSCLQNWLEIGKGWSLTCLYSLFSLLLLISNRFPNLMIISKSVTTFYSWIWLSKTKNFFHFFIIFVGSNFESLSFDRSLKFLNFIFAISRLV